MLCLLHSGLHGASQSQRNPPVAKAFEAAIAEGKQQDNAKHWEEALRASQRAERLAREAGDVHGQALALIQSSRRQIFLFRYHAAVNSAEEGARLALLSGDPPLAGTGFLDSGVVYSQLGDFPLAENREKEAIRYLANSGKREALASCWNALALVQFRQGKISEGKQSCARGIEVARRADLPTIEAYLWDTLGINLLLNGGLSEAEKGLRTAYAIFDRVHDTDLRSVATEQLAELELRRRHYQLALQYDDKAFATAGPKFKTSPRYYPIDIRGQILLGLGRRTEALAEFQRAVDAANSWRETAMPGDVSGMQTVALLHDVYQDYAELAAQLALERHDPELSRKAWEALAENRAASLREQLTSALNAKSGLPPRYFDLLSQLKDVQARVTLGKESEKDRSQLQDIRLELSALENRIGIANENESPSREKNPIRNSLRSIQLRLGKQEILLSFSLGKTQSFLWTVSSETVNLYSLPAESDLAGQAKQFADAVKSGRESTPAATALSRSLFGKLPPETWQKRDWLITADGALLNGVPYAALPDLSSANAQQPIVANHTLRSLPSELLLLTPAKSNPQNRFLGVGDPIYNLADSRRNHSAKLVQTANQTPAASLGRLAGSDREVRSAAKQSGLADVELLLGGNATEQALQRALAKPPEIAHFAVHVVSPDDRPDEAALALSLTKDNLPELITREVVATYRVPGSLVVLSGCSSAQGRRLPSAGLIGLSRAWLLAGASAVVVSSWPTPDDAGNFFSDFYHHLQNIKTGSLSARVAAALQQTQLDMSRSTGYRKSPSYWAAYSIVSKE